MSRHSLPFGLQRNKPVVALHPLCLLKQPAQKIYDGTKRIGPTKRYRRTNVAFVVIHSSSNCRVACRSHQVLLSSVSQTTSPLLLTLRCVVSAQLTRQTQASDCATAPTGCSAAPPVLVLSVRALRGCSAEVWPGGPPSKWRGTNFRRRISPSRQLSSGKV